jgi:thioredoxin 1
MEAQSTGASTVRSLESGELTTIVGEEDVVEFYTEWCGSCTQMEPVLADLSRETDAAVVKVDIETNLETAIEFGAQSTPTFVLFVSGNPVKRLRGSQRKESLTDLIKQYTA